MDTAITRFDMSGQVRFDLFEFDFGFEPQHVVRNHIRLVVRIASCI